MFPESARRALCAGLHALKLPVRMAFTHTFIGVVLCHILIAVVGYNPSRLSSNLTTLVHEGHHETVIFPPALLGSIRYPGCDDVACCLLCFCTDPEHRRLLPHRLAATGGWHGAQATRHHGTLHVYEKSLEF